MVEQQCCNDDQQSLQSRSTQKPQQRHKKLLTYAQTEPNETKAGFTLSEEETDRACSAAHWAHTKPHRQYQYIMTFFTICNKNHREGIPIY